ncbi:MAG: FixH family protein [Candidatus Kapabacteria bacterium]|nr:FixH family protein [Candidatus Kapabacteria bacterium]
MNILKNWGWRIAILYIAFALVTIGMVIYATTRKIDVVEKNYYDKELKYQDQIDIINKSKFLQAEFSISKNQHDLILNFPKNLNKSSKGKILFYCVSDDRRDFRSELILDSSFKQFFDLKSFAKGMWKVKIDLSDSASRYYLETDFNTN